MSGILQRQGVVQEVIAHAVTREHGILGGEIPIQACVVIVQCLNVVLRIREVRRVCRDIGAGNIRIGKRIQVGRADGDLVGTWNDVECGVSSLRGADAAHPAKGQAGLRVINVAVTGGKLRQQGAPGVKVRADGLNGHAGRCSRPGRAEQFCEIARAHHSRWHMRRIRPCRNVFAPALVIPEGEQLVLP